MYINARVGKRGKESEKERERGKKGNEEKR